MSEAGILIRKFIQNGSRGIDIALRHQRLKEDHTAVRDKKRQKGRNQHGHHGKLREEIG